MTHEQFGAQAEAMTSMIADDLLERQVLGLVLESDPVLLANPWPLWRTLTDLAPVIECGPLYLITRYAESKLVYKDNHRFSSDSRRRGTRAVAFRAVLTPERRAAWDEIADFHAIWVVTSDEPAHARLRNIAIRAFTPGRIAELGRAAERYVNEAIERMAEQEVADLMELGRSVPLTIMTDLLDVPKEDRGIIERFSEDWFSYQFVTDDRIFMSLEAQRGLQAYVEDVIEQHRRSPNLTGLVERMIGAEHEERLNSDELAAMYFMLLFAGHETTANLIGTGMLELLRRPAQWEAVKKDASLVGSAVEEMLRFVTPAQYHNRFAVEDSEIAETSIPAGSTVTTLLAAANRDPRVFDDPDDFDIRRRNVTEHLTFGFGPHFCLGASLSRLEGRIAVEALARRLPDLELVDHDIEWRGGAQLRGPASIPVRPGRLRS